MNYWIGEIFSVKSQPNNQIEELKKDEKEKQKTVMMTEESMIEEVSFFFSFILSNKRNFS